MKFNVPYIRQTGPNDCWHAAIRMIYAYKKKASFNPAPSLYKADAGLEPNCAGVAALAKDTGMRPVPIKPCCSAQELEASLRQYGPLWLPLQGPFGHVVVLTGVEKGKLYINDPAWLANPSAENRKERDMVWFNQYFDSRTWLLYLP
jgi:ABC-type bacteriocin/lantibiotic exporter with double-glycine peptidase domain